LPTQPPPCSFFHFLWCGLPHDSQVIPSLPCGAPLRPAARGLFSRGRGLITCAACASKCSRLQSGCSRVVWYPVPLRNVLRLVGPTTQRGVIYPGPSLQGSLEGRSSEWSESSKRLRSCSSGKSGRQPNILTKAGPTSRTGFVRCAESRESLGASHKAIVPLSWLRRPTPIRYADTSTKSIT
jgi:hypothetical protein